jgi:type I restriction enzyme M protein
VTAVSPTTPDTHHSSASLPGNAAVREAAATLVDLLTGTTREATRRERLVQHLLVHLVADQPVPLSRIARDVVVPVGPGRRVAHVDLHVGPCPASTTGPAAGAAEQPTRVLLARPDVHPDEHRHGATLLTQVLETLPNSPSPAEGLWTNGRDIVAMRRTVAADGTVTVEDAAPPARRAGGRLVWPARPDELRVAVRRCLDALYARRALTGQRAVAVLTELVAAGVVDADRPPPRFWAGALKQASAAGRSQASARLRGLLTDAAADQQVGHLLASGHAAALDDATLCAAVAALATVPLLAVGSDLLGVAYETAVTASGRAGRGQYFTPVNVAAALAALVDPQPGERILDPACGSGRLLLACLDQVRTTHGGSTAGAPVLTGIEIDHDLAALAGANLRLRAADGQIHAGDALTCTPLYGDPHPGATGPPPGTGRFDVVVANPPFGEGLTVGDPRVLAAYELACHLAPAADGAWRPTGRRRHAVPPEVLFLERCLAWLRPGGRLGLVLPGGLLSNPGWQPVRAWLLQRIRLLAVVDLPVATFLPAVGMATSLLVAERRAQVTPTWAEQEARRPVFMAVAETVGHDRRGAVTWRRTPEGEVAGGQEVVQLQVRRDESSRPAPVRHCIPRPQVDDDLPEIQAAYQAFRRRHYGAAAAGSAGGEGAA